MRNPFHSDFCGFLFILYSATAIVELNCSLAYSPAFLQSGMVNWERDQCPILADVLLLDPNAPMHLPLSKHSRGQLGTPSHSTHAASVPSAGGPKDVKRSSNNKSRDLSSVGANIQPNKGGGLALDVFYAGVSCG